MLFPAYLRGIETSMPCKIVKGEFRSQPTYEGLKPFTVCGNVTKRKAFPAYLRGIETPILPSRGPGSAGFPAYLRGIETDARPTGRKR